MKVRAKFSRERDREREESKRIGGVEETRKGKVATKRGSPSFSNDVD